MATIRSALSLYDGMTPALRHIDRALNTVLNTFEAVQTASGNSIDTAAIQSAREELARAGAELDQMEQNIRDAENAQDQFNGSVREGANAADGLANKFSKLKGIIATLGITAGIKKLVDLSDQFSSTRARLSLIADDGGSIEAVQSRLNTLAQDKSVDVATNIENNVTTTGMKSVDDLANKLNGLNQNATVSVTATDNGSVDSIQNRLDGLNQAVTVPVDVADRGTVKAVQNQLDSLPTAISVDVSTKPIGTVDDIQKTATTAVNVTDQGTANAIQDKLDGLTKNTVISVTATDNGSVDHVKSRVEGLEEAVTVPVQVTDNDSVKILEAKIWASAQRSRAAYFDTANAIASMGANASSAFSTNDELIAFMEQINKQFVIGGASAQGQAAAMMQLTQAMGAGALRGEELNSILENAPGIARAIEQYMGVAEGSIKKYAEEGMITAEVVKNAMFAAADETNAKFESMPMTWGQIWTSMQNRAIVTLEPILEKINALANSDRMQGMVDSAMDAFSVLIGVLGMILDLATMVGSALYDNWEWIGPIVYGVAGAYLFLHGAMLAYNAVQAISTGLANAHAFAEQVKAAHTAMAAGATLAEAAATTTATGAQVGLNAALLACPLTWIVIGIIAIIAALYAAVGAINHFAGTSVSATGIIGGAFAVLGAHVINTFIVPFWNALAAIANFIGNVFNDPVAAVKVLFYDMALTVVGYIKNMAEAIEAVINKIPGVTVDITSGLDNFYSGLEQAQQKVKDEAGWVEYVQKMDFVDYTDAAKAGYKFGEGVEDKVTGMFKMPTLDEMGFDNFGNNLEGIYGNTGDTAANTAKSADKLEYMDEDLKWMRDIAEREAINRYTTAEITVRQENQNYISKDTDLDGIMDAWAADFAEKLEISGEGV